MKPQSLWSIFLGSPLFWAMILSTASGRQGFVRGPAPHCNPPCANGGLCYYRQSSASSSSSSSLPRLPAHLTGRSTALLQEAEEEKASPIHACLCPPQWAGPTCSQVHTKALVQQQQQHPSQSVLEARSKSLRERLLAVQRALAERNSHGHHQAPGDVSSILGLSPNLHAMATRKSDVDSIATTTAAAASTTQDGLENPVDISGNVQGVTENSAEDVRAFRTNILLQTLILLACVLFFSIGRLYLPAVFQGEAAEGALPSSFFGWIGPSVSLTVPEIISDVGLDRGMFIQFLDFAVRTLLVVGLPQILILCPLHYFFGGNAAGQDQLSTFDMANVTRGSWLCWLHAGTVWYVVVATQWCITSQKKVFVQHRAKWLIEMPAPRATTVLVEEVPEDKNTDEGLKRYFDEQIFGKEVVKNVHVVKDTSDLQNALQRLRSANEMLNIARSGSKRDAVLKAIGGTAESALLAGQMAAQQQVETLKQEIDRTDDLNLRSAFVTFYTRRDAGIVMRLFALSDREEIQVSLPPAPGDIIWKDLMPKGSKQAQTARETVGYMLVALLFILFVPIVLWIAAIARWESLHATFGNLGFDQDPFAYAQEHYPEQVALWNGLVGTVVLTFLMTTVPSFLMWIFSVFVVLKAYTAQQLRVQVWYFYFLVVFVLLVTAIGSSEFGLLQTVTFLVRNPLEIFPRLAEKMPSSTHFYLEYLLVQWGVQALNITRYLNLMKYLALRNLYDAEEAKKMSEPEDQDYYGIGSLSARATLNLTISLVFCTLSPLISIIGLVNFLLARVIHAYLFVYAETKKSDLGGDFFVRSLLHTQQGVFLYVVLMTGVLMERSNSWVPSAIAATSFAYLTNSFFKFQRNFQLREMGLHELEADGDTGLRIYDHQPHREHTDDSLSAKEHYKQPELPEPPEAQARPQPAAADEGGWSSWFNFKPPVRHFAMPVPQRRAAPVGSTGSLAGGTAASSAPTPPAAPAAAPAPPAPPPPIPARPASPDSPDAGGPGVPRLLPEERRERGGCI